MTTQQIRYALVSALTQYDQKQSSRKHYNPYALGQYFARVDEIIADIEAGASPRDAVINGFTGRLGDVCLRALGESRTTQEEYNRLNTSWHYEPLKAKAV